MYQRDTRERRSDNTQDVEAEIASEMNVDFYFHSFYENPT